MNKIEVCFSFENKTITDVLIINKNNEGNFVIKTESQQKLNNILSKKLFVSKKELINFLAKNQYKYNKNELDSVLDYANKCNKITPDKFILDITDYEKIYNSILPVVKILKEDYLLAESCVPMNFFAWNILKIEFPNLKSYFCVGNVVYNINNNFLAFIDNDEINKNWHTYILILNNNKEYYIDFMAPVFDDILKKYNVLDSLVENKMFQKEASVVKEFEDFEKENVSNGDFFFNYKKELTKEINALIETNEDLNNGAKLALYLYRSKKNHIEINGRIINKTNINIKNYW